MSSAAPSASDAPPPLPPSGSWKGEIDGFVSEERCVHDLHITSPLLGEALLLLGYETLAQDACGMVAAARQHDPRRCEVLLASALRTRCLSLVATTSAEPDQCPWLDPRSPRRGRDATCLALATGREGLCAGERSHHDELVCRALFAEDPARCQPLPAEPRAHCQRDVERWRGLLPRRAQGPATIPTTSTLTLHALGEGPADARPRLDLDASVDASLARSDARADWKLELRESQRGVIALGSRGASRLVFGEARYVAPTTFIPPPNGVPRIAFEITSTGALEHLELEVPGRGVLVLPGAKFVGTTKVTDGAGKALEIVDTKSDELRGRAVRIELKGKLDQSPQAYEIDTSIETFVRDVARANL